MTERVLVVGECLVDEIVAADGSSTRHLGGSPANVAVGLARLGRPVDLWTCLGDDAAGHWLAEQVTRAGVRLVGEPFAATATSTATGRVDPTGAVSWEVDLEWTPLPVAHGWAEDVVAVHVGSLGAVTEPGADTVRAMLEDAPSTWFRSFDVNARVAVSGAGPAVLERVTDWLAWTDVARASTEDLVALWPQRPVEETVQAWLTASSRPGTVVLTDGARGLHRISRFSREHVAAPSPWPVVDTVGAGDAVSAAVIDTVLRCRGDMEDWGIVARRAARAGELSVTRAGANAPSATELDAAVLARPGGRGTTAS